MILKVTKQSIAMEVSIAMELPKTLDGLFHGKSHLEMDDNWGYPYFRKPPYSSSRVFVNKTF